MNEWYTFVFYHAIDNSYSVWDVWDFVHENFDDDVDLRDELAARDIDKVDLPMLGMVDYYNLLKEWRPNVLYDLRDDILDCYVDDILYDIDHYGSADFFDYEIYGITEDEYDDYLEVFYESLEVGREFLRRVVEKRKREIEGKEED